MLSNKHNTSSSDKFGWLLVESFWLWPYTVINGIQYVPTFYIHGDLLRVKRHIVFIRNPHLNEIKFCCKMLGVKGDLYDVETIAVVPAEVLKRLLPKTFSYEDYWPGVNKRPLTNKLLHSRIHFSAFGKRKI